MADKKISQLTELTSADPAIDVLPLVDSDLNQTKKIKLANLPLSDAAFEQSYPYTVDFQNGVKQTRDLASIAFSDGYGYTGQPSSIYIGSNVTTIDAFGFSFSPLTSITIPDSVTSIGDFAFQNCSSITNATIGNSVTSIGRSAFDSCYIMTSATIGNSVTSIGDYAFKSCTDLQSVIIPDSVTSIGSTAFNGCSSLTSATIGNSVTSIGNYAFASCGSLTSVIIPDSVTSIGNYAFGSCTGLTSATIGNSVTSIGGFAFAYCAGLATINCLATTAPTLGSSAFASVATSDIHVPVGANYPATYGGLIVVFDL